MYSFACQNPGQQWENKHHYFEKVPLPSFAIHCARTQGSWLDKIIVIPPVSFINITHMLHRLYGIFTYIWHTYIYGKCIGKYSSPMEHLAKCKVFFFYFLTLGFIKTTLGFGNGCHLTRHSTRGKKNTQWIHKRFQQRVQTSWWREKNRSFLGGERVGAGAWRMSLHLG